MEQINENKYTIVFTDGTQEVVYGSELIHDDNYFYIEIENVDGEIDKTISYPYYSVRKVIEE